MTRSTYHMTIAEVEGAIAEEFFGWTWRAFTGGESMLLHANPEAFYDPLPGAKPNPERWNENVPRYGSDILVALDLLCKWRQWGMPKGEDGEREMRLFTIGPCANDFMKGNYYCDLPLDNGAVIQGIGSTISAAIARAVLNAYRTSIAKPFKPEDEQ